MTIRSFPIIGVADVEKSSKWYQRLLGCKSAHGGPVFEMLADENHNVFLSLHKWQADDHEHPTLENPSIPTGNGLLLYLMVEDLERSWQAARALKAQIERPIGMNENAHKMEFSVRDLDGYYVTVSAQ